MKREREREIGVRITLEDANYETGGGDDFSDVLLKRRTSDAFRDKTIRLVLERSIPPTGHPFDELVTAFYLQNCHRRSGIIAMAGHVCASRVVSLLRRVRY